LNQNVAVKRLLDFTHFSHTATMGKKEPAYTPLALQKLLIRVIPGGAIDQDISLFS
jgi:hypothetical protein